MLTAVQLFCLFVFVFSNYRVEGDRNIMVHLDHIDRFGLSSKSSIVLRRCSCTYCLNMRQATRCSPLKKWRRSVCCSLRWASSPFDSFSHLQRRGVNIWAVFQVEESVLNIGKFNSMVSLAAFFPFKSAQAALENMNAISEGTRSPHCGRKRRFLSCNDVFIICQSTEILCWHFLLILNNWGTHWLWECAH